MLVGVPVPGGVSVRAVLRTEEASVIRAESEGFLAALNVKPGDQAKEGDVLATVLSPHLEERVVNATAAVEAARLRLRAAEASGALDAKQARVRLTMMQADFDELIRQRDNQNLSVLVAGVIACDGEIPKVGSWIAKGQEIVRLHRGRFVARTLLTEEQFTLVAPKIGDAIQFRSVSNRGESRRGVVRRVVKQASRFVDDLALTQRGGGEIAVDPIRKKSQKPHFYVECDVESSINEHWHGTSGRILFEGENETVGRKLWRSAINLANRLKHGSF